MAAVPLVGLAGCGFRPLHGSGGTQDASVAADLATVRIDPLNERVGQQLHNFLRDRLNPHGQPVSPNYRLSVALAESLTGLGVRRDETASRANLRLDADFTLLDAAGETRLFQGRSSSTTSYDILRNPFALSLIPI